MNHPDWRAFTLDGSALPEPNADPRRLVVWFRTDHDNRFQYWERIASVARAEVASENGLCMMAATSIRARQRVGGLVAWSWNRLRASDRTRNFDVPGGSSAEQCGERQNDVMLVWSESAEDGLDEARLRSLWPRASGVRKLGERLYAVSGLESRAGAPGPSKMAAMTSPDESPVAHAEAILAAARLSGARDREATALTDLGVIALNEGNAKGAIEFLEQALAITVESGDTAREGDVAGNLGMAMLAVRQPGRARNLFERTLAIARATSDRFAEKVALERLGIAAWAVRDYGGALGLFNQALSLARQLGDRQQQANLLWHQGIQHAELGQRDLAIARAEESVALFSALGKPQAASFGAYLQKYRMGLADDRTVAAGAEATVEGSPQAYMGGSIVASVMANAPSADIESARSTRGPGLLRMALSATKAAAGFAGSGFKTTPPDARKRRFEACAACEHHTGVRCQICGCFTGAKSRILHEDCPIGKWPA